MHGVAIAMAASRVASLLARKSHVLERGKRLAEQLADCSCRFLLLAGWIRTRVLLLYSLLLSTNSTVVCCCVVLQCARIDTYLLEPCKAKALPLRSSLSYPMLRVLTSAIPLLETLLLQLSAKESSCELYIAPSLLVGSGLGVYAGKAFRVGDKVLHVPRVAYMNHDLDVSHFQLDNYVFGGYTDGSNILAFGVAMIFNSKKDSHVWFESGDYNEDYLPRLAAFQVMLVIIDRKSAILIAF